MFDGGNTTIQGLLDQAAAGDVAVYDQVINATARRLQVLTAQMLRNYPRLRRWEETGDIFQSAAIRLHRSLSVVKPETVRDFFGLAATQIRRTLIDLARHHYGPLGQAANHHSDPAATGQGQFIDRRAARSDQPETLEAWTAFHESVDNLPEHERDVFGLVWYHGLPQAEIAVLLGVSVPTVKRRLRNARLLLASATAKQNSGDSHGR